MAKKKVAPPESAAVPPATAPTEELEALVRRAEAGDESALPALRRFLDERPDLLPWGDMYGRAINYWIRLAAGKNLLTKECMIRKVVELREGLTETPGSKLEELLVQQTVLSWFQSMWASSMLALQTEKAPSPELIERAEKRQANAQKRFLAATKQLAVVRKLLKPAPSAFELLSRPGPDAKPVAGHPFGGRLGTASKVAAGNVYAAN